MSLLEILEGVNQLSYKIFYAYTLQLFFKSIYIDKVYDKKMKKKI